MDPFMASLAAGGLAFGQDYLSSRGKKKQAKSYKKRFRGALGATEALQGASLGQREALSRLATQQQLGGFDTARREASRMGRGAKRSALDRETQAMARGNQNLANRGLGSTTRSGNLDRSIASDTNREMSSIDEGLAGMFGDLAIGRGGVQAGGTQQLAGLAGERGDTMSQIAQMRSMGQYFGASPWGGGGPMPEIPNSFGQSLMTGAQTGLGAFMGMGGGGGGMGGMGGGMGGMDPEILQYLFGQGGGMGGNSLGSGFGGGFGGMMGR